MKTIEKYGLTVKKNYGQNFLTDTHVLNKIVAAAGISKEDFVLEIGPGIGGLTQALAEHAGKVTAVEIDAALIPVLTENLREYSNVELVNADIMKLDINELITTSGYQNVKVAANLPYYITTPIIMMLLEQPAIRSMTVMMQKEVAGRLCAKPGSKEYGSITLAVRYHADVYLAANVPSHCFVPRPNVDSAVVRLDVLKEPRIKAGDTGLLFQIIRAAFNQRRKTLVNSIYNTAGLDISKEDIIKALKTAGFDENTRGEQLSLEDFGALAESLFINR